MQPLALAVFGFVAFIFSVIIHEVAHGVVAERLGDPTARNAGRITLNPLKHIDPMGSILLPAILLITHSPVILGWAKPVPYDPRHLPNPKAAAGKIAAAGPLSNFVIAALFALLTRLALGMGWSPALTDAFATIVLLNISLAVFNLVPIPPLDGSKVLFALLPASRGAYQLMALLERYGLILIFAFLFFAGQALFPIVNFIFNLLIGV
jgi:Zn-dependent protease